MVPKLWDETIDEHRRAVREAILGATVSLADERGVTAVTMSAVAERAGIGRATLYKYFPDVASILVAWHQGHVADHFDHLTALRDQAASPDEGLAAVLDAYARICYWRARHGADYSALVHRSEHVRPVQQQLTELFSDLIARAAAAGKLRNDAAADELAAYCLHALAAAGDLGSEDAVGRLVTVTLDGLRPPR
ncbi:TetR/AcrR family transcriptional regulator [Glycomyces tenuis]|uniref:TetR/AcrR family transcriptional regulator n=1 Tax=Glycomyces tenuis TaxID=58116 RepID=UPI000400E59B|nr:TetR/AcrR family transcriptional regulator [Glycomyces tenuis]